MICFTNFCFTLSDIQIGLFGRTGVLDQLARVDIKLDRALVNHKWKELWAMMLCELYLGGSSDHLGMELRFHLIEKP